MERLDRAARAIAHAAAMVGGTLLLASALLICADVFLRYFFVVSVGGADELSGYALGIAAAWGFSYALLSRSHVRIDALYTHIPPAARPIIDLAGLAAFMVFMGYVTWRGWGVLNQSIISGARSISALEVPLVVPQTAWVAGLVYFLLVALLLLLRAIVALAGGNRDLAFRLIGSKAAMDEVQEELAGAQQAHREQGGAR